MPKKIKDKALRRLYRYRIPFPLPSHQRAALKNNRAHQQYIPPTSGPRNTKCVNPIAMCPYHSLSARAVSPLRPWTSCRCTPTTTPNQPVPYQGNPLSATTHQYSAHALLRSAQERSVAVHHRPQHVQYNSMPLVATAGAHPFILLPDSQIALPNSDGCGDHQHVPLPDGN